MLSGYLQNGEAVVMKRALLIAGEKLKPYDARIVNFVHDEFLIEVTPEVLRCWETLCEVRDLTALSIKEAGIFYDLNCPLAGSGDVGETWAEIH